MSSTPRRFEDWYRDEHPRLFTSLLGLTGDRDIASDATDEALSRALQHWRRVGRMDSPGAWTYRVAVNVVHRRLRRRRLEQRLLPRLWSHGSSPPPSGEVWHLVRDLPERQRCAVVLRYVGGLTEPEIAQVMGVTRGTVSSSLTAARARLRDVLDEQMIEEGS